MKAIAWTVAREFGESLRLPVIFTGLAGGGLVVALLALLF